MFKKSHAGLLEKIQGILQSTPSLEYYPFFQEIVKMCDDYGKRFTVGKVYRYRLMHFKEGEFTRARFVGMDGDKYLFGKLDELPQYDQYEALSEFEIVDMQEMQDE